MPGRRRKIPQVGAVKPGTTVSRNDVTGVQQDLTVAHTTVTEREKEKIEEQKRSAEAIAPLPDSLTTDAQSAVDVQIEKVAEGMKEQEQASTEESEPVEVAAEQTGTEEKARADDAQGAAVKVGGYGGGELASEMADLGHSLADDAAFFTDASLQAERTGQERTGQLHQSTGEMDSWIKAVRASKFN